MHFISFEGKDEHNNSSITLVHGSEMLSLALREIFITSLGPIAVAARFKA
jgi:hypothetical protein